MAHKYSVILCTLASGGGDVWEDPRGVLEAVAGAGFDGVDLDAEPDRIPAARFDEVRDIAASLGLEVPALIGAWALWHAGEERDLASPEAGVRQHGIDYARKCIDLAATFANPPTFEIVACPAENDYPQTKTPRGELRARFAESARAIAGHGAQAGVSVAIEPINRFEGYAGFLNSLAEAVAIADDLAMDNLGVLADFFHVNIEDRALTDALRLAGHRLMHVHLADSNRQLPGTGHIDFLQVIRTLNDISFSGYLSLDCVPALPDWRTQVREALPFMKRLEEMAAIQESIENAA